MTTAWKIQQAPDQVNYLSVLGQFQGSAIDEEAQEELRQLISRYRQAQARRHSDDMAGLLLPIGKDLYRWLQRHQLIQGMNQRGQVQRLEFHLNSTDGLELGQPAAVFADLIANTPWEILADDSGFLAVRQRGAFVVSRHFPGDPKKWSDSPYQLAVHFMAASPSGQAPLDYRNEEFEIEQRTQFGELDLFVEESGELEQLAARLRNSADDAVNIVHLSVHGGHRGSRPVLALEDENSRTHMVDPDELWSELGFDQVRLYFISACHSAETGRSAPNQAGEASYASQLVSFGAPACIAWAGAVSDVHATRFAARLYRHLSKNHDLLRAYQEARHELLNDPNSDWHLAQLSIAGPQAPNLRTGQLSQQRHDNMDNLLGGNRKIPVARFAEFVGRRKELKHSLRLLKQKQAVLLQGPGHRGKSSLAAYLSRRLPKHQTLALYGKEFSIDTLLHRITESDYSSEQILELCKQVQTARFSSQQSLRIALRDLFKAIAQQQSLLLILDDFEQCLADPVNNGLHRVKEDLLISFDALLGALRHVPNHHLIITSRYQFESPFVPDYLKVIPLEPFTEIDHLRQSWRLWQQWYPTLELDEEPPHYALYLRALRVAHGSPGLMRRMYDAIHTDPATGEAFIEQVEAYVEQGREVTDSKVADYLEQMGLGLMMKALNSDEQRLLAYSKSWNLALPHAALKQALLEDLPDLDSAIQRLMSFGLWNQWADLVDRTQPAYSVNDLLKKQIIRLGTERLEAWDRRLLPALEQAWPVGQCPLDCDREIVDRALALQDSDVTQRRAVVLLSQMYQHNLYGVGYGYACKCLELLNDQQSVHLYFHAGRLAFGQGDYDQALSWWQKSLNHLPKESRLEGATIQGKIADILYQRGQLNEALRIRTQEQLPVLRELGDSRSIVHTQGKIADILVQRGQLDEALRIRTEEQVPILQELGDRFAIAVTQGQIVDILIQRGQLDEALRICTQEMLPIFHELSDRRSLTITQGKIADILHQRGQLDEALRIRTQEQLPILRELGDRREIAITQDKIADILAQRGQHDEALHIYSEGGLHVYRELGDRRQIAMTQSKIADILFDRGQFDEALRIHTQEQLPVLRELGDRRQIAITQSKIADILYARGQFDEALRIRSQEELPVFLELSDRRSVATTQGKIADILYTRGRLDEALRIRTQEVLPVFRELGDQDGIATCMYKIGKIELLQEQWQSAFESLSVAYQLFQTTGRWDGLVYVGRDLGRFLFLAGEKKQGLQLIKNSLGILEQMNLHDKATEFKALIADLESRK